MGRRWGQGVEREASAPGLLQSKGRDLETGFGEAEREMKICSSSPWCPDWGAFTRFEMVCCHVGEERLFVFKKK